MENDFSLVQKENIAASLGVFFCFSAAALFLLENICVVIPCNFLCKNIYKGSRFFFFLNEIERMIAFLPCRLLNQLGDLKLGKL